MRLSVIVALLFVPTSLSAQTSPCMPAQSRLLDFDPYKPSHLAIVRNYGGTVLSQAPISELLKLDPYSPTDGALLRQLGGAIPFWAYTAYPWYVPAPSTAPAEPCTPVSDARTPEASAAGLSSFRDVLTTLNRPAPPSVSPTPQRTRGISVEFDGRLWVSDGAAVPFSTREFVPAREQGGFTIYRRARGNAAVIYIPTTPGMVAPFRAVDGR